MVNRANWSAMPGGAISGAVFGSLVDISSDLECLHCGKQEKVKTFEPNGWLALMLTNTKGNHRATFWFCSIRCCVAALPELETRIVVETL